MALSFGLFLAVPGSSPGFAGLLEAAENSNSLFLGRLDPQEAMGRGWGYPGMQMLDPTMGRRAVASQYPPAIQPLVPVACILAREIILHLSSSKHPLRMWVAMGRLWASK